MEKAVLTYEGSSMSMYKHLSGAVRATSFKARHRFSPVL